MNTARIKHGKTYNEKQLGVCCEEALARLKTSSHQKLETGGSDLIFKLDIHKDIKWTAQHASESSRVVKNTPQTVQNSFQHLNEQFSGANPKRQENVSTS